MVGLIVHHGGIPRRAGNTVQLAVVLQLKLKYGQLNSFFAGEPNQEQAALVFCGFAEVRAFAVGIASLGKQAHKGQKRILMAGMN